METIELKVFAISASKGIGSVRLQNEPAANKQPIVVVFTNLSAAEAKSFDDDKVYLLTLTEKPAE